MSEREPVETTLNRGRRVGFFIGMLGAALFIGAKTWACGG